jgi:pimeloyl-ACP methyl ester carboxylesterase
MSEPVSRFQPESSDRWHGFHRDFFTVAGRTCWLVKPKRSLPGKPWTWCMMFPDAFTERTGVPLLLARGYYHLFMDVGNTFGCPSAMRQLDAFYGMFRKMGLAKKGVLIGISRGALYAFNWAARNPNKVAGLYADAGVLDFKSWPAGKGRGPGSAEDWKMLRALYGFPTAAKAMAYKKNPVDNLRPLARARIPLLLVVGDADEVVPVEENTALVETRYRGLGGRVTVIHKPGVGHHPHGLADPTPIVQFVMEGSR